MSQANQSPVVYVERVEGLDEELERVIREAEDPELEAQFRAIQRLPRKAQEAWVVSGYSPEELAGDKRELTKSGSKPSAGCVLVTVMVAVVVYEYGKPVVKEVEKLVEKCGEAWDGLWRRGGVPPDAGGQDAGNQQR